MTKPFFELESQTKARILGLIEKCDELNLDNVNFNYLESPCNPITLDFVMERMYKTWELTVIAKDLDRRDFYKIANEKIVYLDSKQD